MGSNPRDALRRLAAFKVVPPSVPPCRRATGRLDAIDGARPRSRLRHRTEHPLRCQSLRQPTTAPTPSLAASKLHPRAARDAKHARRCAKEFAVADRVLAERRELTIVAARIFPPDYIKSELGERPSDPAKQKAWDRGVSQIERFAKSTASRTRTEPLDRRRNEGLSEHGRKRPDDGSKSCSESSASGSTRRERASSAEDEHRPMSGSALIYRRLKHRSGGLNPLRGRAQAPLTAAVAMLFAGRPGLVRACGR